MAREGRTLTRTMGFDPRQHELFGIDLGDGPPRRAMFWGALCFAVWWGLLWVILGPPTSQLSLLWLLPPALLAVYGWRDGRTSRRRNVTEWALTLRWLARGCVPVVALGRHPVTRSERPSVLERVGHRFGGDDPTAVVLPWRASASTAAAAARPEPGATVGGKVQRTQLIGTDLASRRRRQLVERTAGTPRRAGRGRHVAPRNAGRNEPGSVPGDVAGGTPVDEEQQAVIQSVGERA